MTGLRLRGGAACFLLRDCLAVLLTTHCPLVATAQHSPDIAQNNQGELPGAGLDTHALPPQLTEQRTCEEISGQISEQEGGASHSHHHQAMFTNILYHLDLPQLLKNIFGER